MTHYNYEECPQGFAISTGRNFNYAFLIPLIKKLLRYKEKIRILEIGCGGARNLQVLKAEFEGQVDLYGIDISESGIKYAKGLGIGTFEVSNSDKIPFNNRYDLILMIDILEHLPTTTTVLNTLEASTNKLDQGGYIYISIPIELERYTLTWLFSKFKFTKDLTKLFFGHTLQFSGREFISLLTKNNYHIRHTFYSAHLFTQLQLLLFFYIPKVVLKSFFNEELFNQVRDSNELVSSKRSKMYILKKLMSIASTPLSYLGYYESKLRRYKALAGENVHVLISKDKTS